MSQKTILLVDDDKDVLYGLNIRLRTSGYNVVVATDAISAISTGRKEKPDLIILDIGLPGGGGFLVLERLRSLYDLALVPVIVLSASETASNREHALKAGAQAYFQKPVENDKFLAAVRQALGEKQEPAQQTR